MMDYLITADNKKELIKEVIEVCQKWAIEPKDLIYKRQRGKLEFIDFKKEKS